MNVFMINASSPLPSTYSPGMSHLTPSISSLQPTERIGRGAIRLWFFGLLCKFEYSHASIDLAQFPDTEPIYVGSCAIGTIESGSY